MRHAVFLLTALAAIFAHSDEYEWYDPTGELPLDAIGSATITVGNESMSCGVLPNGELIASDTHSQQVFDSWEQKKGKDPSFAVAFNALQKSLTAEMMSRNIAKRLDSLFGENRLTVDNGDGTSSTASITISDNGSGTASMSISGLTRGADPDGVTIEKKSDGKLGVIGVNAGNSPEIMYTIGGAIASAPISDYADGVSVGVKTTTAGGRQLEIKNWSSAPLQAHTIADALSGNRSFDGYGVVARSASGGRADVPVFIPIGRIAGAGGTNTAYKADGYSLAQDEDGTNTTFSVRGFSDADDDTILAKVGGNVEYLTPENDGGVFVGIHDGMLDVSLDSWGAPDSFATIADMMTTNAAERASHKVLCRRTDADGNASLVYEDVGTIRYSGNMNIDGYTIETNDFGSVGIANFHNAPNGAVLQAVKQDESYGVAWVVPTNGVAVSTSEGVKTGKYLKFDTVEVSEGYFDLPSASVEGDHIVATFSVATVEYVRDVTFEDGALTAHYGVLEIPVMYCSTNSHTRTVFQTVNHSDL